MSDRRAAGAKKPGWGADDIGDLTGRRALITGVTGGLGLHTALQLARHGADLVVTARDAARADDALRRLRDAAPRARVEVVTLDLADLAGVRRAADRLLAGRDRLDILVNNAGIMVPPFRRTADGFELQIGTNHLGHFLWTASVWPLLADDARVVSVSSLAHRCVRGIDLRSLTPEGSPRRYRRWQSYGESKLANLLFALELDRRTKAAGLAIASVASHPGLAATNLTRTGSSLGGGSLLATGLHQITRAAGQSAAMGALSLLRAATDPALAGGEYLGPGGPGGTRGRPVIVAPSSTAYDPGLAAALWAASESATGITFDS